MLCSFLLCFSLFGFYLSFTESIIKQIRDMKKEKEEYPGEFKDNVIKIILLLPTIVFAGLYFYYDNQLYLYF